MGLQGEGLFWQGSLGALAQPGKGLWGGRLSLAEVSIASRLRLARVFRGARLRLVGISRGSRLRLAEVSKGVGCLWTSALPQTTIRSMVSSAAQFGSWDAFPRVRDAAVTGAASARDSGSIGSGHIPTAEGHDAQRLGSCRYRP